MLITLWLIIPAIHAQKVGLVLSGGGAKGMTHIGIIRALEENNIPAMIYYPVPLHKQKAFLPIARQGGDLSVSETLSEQVLSLPMHTELDNEQQQYIIGKVREFFNR